MLVLNAGFVIIANVPPEFLEGKLSEYNREVLIWKYLYHANKTASFAVNKKKTIYSLT